MWYCDDKMKKKQIEFIILIYFNSEIIKIIDNWQLLISIYDEYFYYQLEVNRLYLIIFFYKFIIDINKIILLIN
jgi:hypothetical protein